LKITLFHFPTACSRVTMNALEEIGLEYGTQMVNLHAGEQKSPQYLAINPKGKVPAMRIDAQLLTENAVMLGLLDRLYPAAGLLPRSEDPIHAVQPLIDMDWCAATLHPIVRQIRNPQRWTKGSDTSGIQADGIEKMSAECTGFAERLSTGRWWYGERWSIVDTYIYWVYSTSGRGGVFPLERFPALLEHAARVRERPSFQRVLKRERASLETAGLPIPDSF
jgi:glutathione S-transferase